MRPMATERQRELVWEGIFEAERLHLYYGYLAESLEKWDSRLTLLNLVLSSGAFAIVLKQWSDPALIAAGAFLAIAVSSFLLVLKRYSRKSVYSAELHRAFADLKIEWEALWSKVDELDSSKLEEEYSRLQRRAIQLTERAPVELTIDKQILDRSDREAREYLGAAA